MHYENRHYIIFNTDEIHLIDFNEVMETSQDTLRLSIDGTMTFVKYQGEMPPSVQLLTTRSQEYSHDEIMEILSTEEWTALINQE